MRIGHGFDAHVYVPGRRLILGGVEIPYERGMAAHSDGDVVLHALCDALLGAAALGDIGRHFPDSDPDLEGIDSRILLKRVVDMVKSKGFAVENADLTIIAQAPRLAPYADGMAENIAADLGVERDRVNVKASTTEKLGFIGRTEGIAAFAVVLLT